MTIKELAATIQAEITPGTETETSVSHGYASDLLSDVMAHAAEGSVLITIQAHANTVAVASLTDLSGIIICNGRTVPDEMKEAAVKKGIAVLTTADNQYKTSWKVHEALES